jgi:hypothetical protein
LVSISPTSALGDAEPFCWSAPLMFTIFLLQNLSFKTYLHDQPKLIISFANQDFNDIINTL